MGTINKIQQNHPLKWACRIIIFFLALITLTNGLDRLSINDDTQVILGLFQIILVACFLIWVIYRLTNKIDNNITKQEKQKQTENESKNSH